MTDEQKAEILALVAERKLSYDLIAEQIGNGCTRGVVAGIVFRNRHPPMTRCHSPNSNSLGHGNKTGTGWQETSYRPEKTAQNTR